MKSIFSGDYSSNIHRINHSHQPSPSRGTAESIAGDQFSDVLARLEPHGRSADPEQAKRALNDELTKSLSDFGRTTAKEDESNQSSIAPDLSALVTHFSVPRTPDGPPVCPMANWSKGEGLHAAARVKNLAQQGVTGTKAVRSYERQTSKGPAYAPPTPVLRLAARYEGQHVVNTMAFGSDDIKNVIETAGKFHGIDPALSMAVATAESSLRPDAISKDGFRSKGLFQLLDTTGKAMQTKLGVTDKYDPFDPAMNAHLGVGYLRYLHDLFSSPTDLGSNLRTIPVRSAEQLEKLAVAAFNAGEGNVAQAQARARREGKDPATYEGIKAYLPASTREYVTRVTNIRNEIDPSSNGTELA
jgi:soluble lytic murein transglycosylase-like protein